MPPGAVDGQIMIRARCESKKSRADSSCSDGIVRTRATPYMSGQRPPPTDGLLPRRVCPARPILGTCARLGSLWARLPLAGFAGDCALCVVFLCKSCFIRDIYLCGPMAWFPGAYVLRALSWAYVRVWGAAGRGCHSPASPGIAHFAHSS
jgi:hypothetical protein